MRPSIICSYLFAATATAKWWTKEEPSCAVVVGSAEGIAYRYYSASHFAQPCVTSEMNERIRSSIDHSMKKLLYGPKDKVKLAKYCGPSIEVKLKPSCSRSSAFKSEL
jgi:hypothetical protein